MNSQSPIQISPDANRDAISTKSDETSKIDETSQISPGVTRDAISVKSDETPKKFPAKTIVKKRLSARAVTLTTM